MPKQNKSTTAECCSACLRNRRACRPYPGGSGCQACFSRREECSLLPLDRATSEQSVCGALRSFLKLYGCSSDQGVTLRLEAYELFDMVLWQHNSVLQSGLLSEVPYRELLQEWAQCFPATLRHTGPDQALQLKLRLSRQVLEWPVTRALLRNPQCTASIVLDLSD
jgi:hypothetical protein